MKEFGGRVVRLDRSDINTDEIIPAKYLTEISREALKPYLLEDLKLDGFDPASEELRQAGVIVTRANFGCGSSREHAVWVLEVNGINVVVAESFARIFRQNMFNCGMLAVELAPEEIDAVFAMPEGLTATVDVDRGVIAFTAGGESREFSFTLNGFERDLVKAGGWLAYADSKY